MDKIYLGSTIAADGILGTEVMSRVNAAWLKWKLATAFVKSGLCHQTRQTPKRMTPVPAAAKRCQFKNDNYTCGAKIDALKTK